MANRERLAYQPTVQPDAYSLAAVQEAFEQGRTAGQSENGDSAARLQDLVTRLQALVDEFKVEQEEEPSEGEEEEDGEQPSDPSTPTDDVPRVPDNGDDPLDPSNDIPSDEEAPALRRR